MVNVIIDKYINEYKYLLDYYLKQYKDLPQDTVESDFQYCFWLSSLQYHPHDDYFKEYFIILLDAQLKQSRAENTTWK